MPVFLSFVVMNEERFILAWNTPLPDAAFKLTIYRQIESPLAIERVYLGVKCDAQEFDILIEGYQGQFDSFITPDKIEDLRQNIDDFARDPERRADKGKTILEYLKTLEISKCEDRKSVV
jgi:hypothetical protein